MDESKDVIIAYIDDKLFDDAILKLIAQCVELVREHPYLVASGVKHYTDFRVPVNYIEVYMKDTRSL